MRTARGIPVVRASGRDVVLSTAVPVHGVTSAAVAAPRSAWSPLRLRTFRALWLAALASNVGNWMHEVSAAWLMTSLTPAPLMVALLGTAMSLPLFLFALPSGAVGDIVDRRRYLIFTQVFLAVASGLLTATALAGLMTPTLLLVFTFVMGTGAALYMPVWQATTPELVPREELAAAITLGGISVNVARAIGPALGGILLAATSPGVVFGINTLSFVAVAFVVWRWRRTVTEVALPPERIGAAVRGGARYVLHAPEYQAVLVRTAAFIVFGTAVWALLPTVGRQQLGLGALAYGLLVGAFGVGAVSTAMLLPRIRARLSIDATIAAGTVAFAGTAAVLALTRSAALAYCAMFIGGGGWICILASLNTASQQTAAGWVRARALAVYSVVFQGGTAAGSAFWGSLAQGWGVRLALLVAAGGMLASLVVALRFRLAGRAEPNLAPSAHWPEPVLVTGEDGAADEPVLVVVEYRVDPENAGPLLDALQELRRVRRRDGALEWNVYRDAADESRYVEEFVVGSWAEHLRQHERFTIADRELEARVRSFQKGGEAVRVTHLLRASARPRRRTT